MMTTAWVLREPGRPAVRETVALREPSGELVRVRVTASGVCHSDLHAYLGEWSMPGPIVLGHEGAGVVEAVGEDVRGLEPGDRVALSWYAPCGRCRHCRAGRAWLCEETSSLDHLLPDASPAASAADGSPVHAFLGLGTFADHVLVPQSAVIPMPSGVPDQVAALIGCAVTTGVGAVLNTARVRAGESAVVVGLGGVGQAILLGLRLAGADPVIAVDLSVSRREQARALGATHVLDGALPDLVERLLELTDGGADHAFEAVGRADTISLVPTLLGAGGQAVLVGMPAEGVTVEIDPFALADRGRRIVGCNYGSSVPHLDFPRLARLYLAGRLDLDALVGAVRPMSELDLAFNDLRAAEGLRTILIPEGNH